MDERAERLLQHLEREPVLLGRPVVMNRSDLLEVTGSEEIEEVLFLERYLQRHGWIQVPSGTMDTIAATVTVEGHIHIADRMRTTDSAQAFVAMWFDESMKAAYSTGVEPALNETGYRALRIDQKEHVNKIEDEIVAEIRRSRFVIADFTHGEHGVRGGVYYEAGFAHGLGLDVILTCHEDRFHEVHFDTNHYNHIVWTSPGDLREKLKSRILAVIGEGPELDRAE